MKLLLGVAVVIGVFSYWKYSQNDSYQLEESAPVQSESTPSANEYAQSESDESEGDRSDHISPQLRHEVSEWYQSHGYYFDLDAPAGLVEKSHSYDSLDNDSLKQLVESGDLVAASMLGDRLIGSLDEEAVELGLQIHREAVTLGSTYSSIALGGTHLARPATGDPSKDLAEIGEGLSWMLFAAERGDPAGVIHYNDYMASNNIDPGLAAAFCARSREIRSKVDRERVLRGYGDLENTQFPDIPEEIRPTLLSPIESCK